MPRAHILVRFRPPYNGDSFARGLMTMGYEIFQDASDKPDVDDVVVMWNRHPGWYETVAQRYENAGARVIIVENGYLGRDFKGDEWYAVARDQHNGAGLWWNNGPDRWASLGIELLPWRQTGDDIVLLAGRGMGSNLCRPIAEWTDQTFNALKKRTARQIRQRRHPGPKDAWPGKPLLEAIHGSHAVVTWSSSAAIKSIIAGYPAFYAMPDWIGFAAARELSHDLEDPFLGDRLPMLQRMAWAMWSRKEIERGDPFRILLGDRG